MGKEASGVASGAGAGAAFGPIGAGVGAVAGGIMGIMAKKQQRDAEAAAGRALEAAKQQIDVNRLEALRVPTDVYERAFQNTVAMQNQSLQSLTEADPRALAAGVGKLQGMATQQDAQTRDIMAQALYDREKMVADEQQRIDTSLADLDLAEAQGAQEAASQAQQMAAQSFSGAISSVGQAGQMLYENSALYKEKGNRDMAKAIQGNNDLSISEKAKAIGGMQLTDAAKNRILEGDYNPFGLNSGMSSIGFSPQITSNIGQNGYIL